MGKTTGKSRRRWTAEEKAQIVRRHLRVCPVNQFGNQSDFSIHYGLGLIFDIKRRQMTKMRPKPVYSPCLFPLFMPLLPLFAGYWYIISINCAHYTTD